MIILEYMISPTLKVNPPIRKIFLNGIEMKIFNSSSKI
nr:MAG TPA: hypothetical protein [Caudoviricetes sp.]